MFIGIGIGLTQLLKKIRESVANGFMLLENDVDKILLEDGVSFLLLEI